MDTDEMMSTNGEEVIQVAGLDIGNHVDEYDGLHIPVDFDTWIRDVRDSILPERPAALHSATHAAILGALACGTSSLVSQKLGLLFVEANSPVAEFMAYFGTHTTVIGSVPIGAMIGVCVRDRYLCTIRDRYIPAARRQAAAEEGRPALVRMLFLSAFSGFIAPVLGAFLLDVAGKGTTACAMSEVVSLGMAGSGCLMCIVLCGITFVWLCYNTLVE